MGPPMVVEGVSLVDESMPWTDDDQSLLVRGETRSTFIQALGASLQMADWLQVTAYIT
jgi:hypothetical protein